MSKVKIASGYLLLFPGLGLFYFGLLVIGGMGDPPFELESYRPFGSPSLANLIEVPLMATFGGIIAVVVRAFRSSGRLQESVRRVVALTYVVAFLFYLFMPTLPE